MPNQIIHDDDFHVNHRIYMKKYRASEKGRLNNSCAYYKRATGLTDADLTKFKSIEEKIEYMKALGDYRNAKKICDAFEEKWGSEKPAELVEIKIVKPLAPTVTFAEDTKLFKDGVLKKS
tara:strand:- start:2016 stop:2375 length:360 start_codon:yes stop_codon:yes gene_type:complete